MANLAVILKQEIRRLARKEVKLAIAALRQAITRLRRELSQLKREYRDFDQRIVRCEQNVRESQNTSPVAEEPQQRVRFSPRSIKAQRRRLGLSAAEYGKLVGVSPLTIYNWEQGKSRPRQAHLRAFLAVRGIGRREALARLANTQAGNARGRHRQKNSQP